MADTPDELVAELERQLESVERSLSGVDALNERQASRVADRMDRLSSQLLEISAPTDIHDADRRAGVKAASEVEFAELAREMAAPDGEG